MIRILALLALLLAPAALLGGCGKKGDPDPPSGREAVSFPRQYPR